MPKVALYSRSKRSSPGADTRTAATEAAPGAVAPAIGVAAQPASAASPFRPGAPAATAGAAPTAPGRLRRALARWQGPLWGLAGALLVGMAVTWHALLAPKPHLLTQKDIDAAVLHTLDSTVLPAAAARAVDAIRPSVVHVRGMHKIGKEDEPTVMARAPGVKPPHGATAKPAPADDEAPEGYRVGIGSGVVIVDSGLILTNLHVVAGSETIIVTFYDGFESPADVVSMQPENDLAVLKARKIPDDLQAATLRSTTDLNVGDEVIAVGFPFGIGPSASAGIVSGLKREFRSSEGKKRQLTNLIQFDAAANPGNSGGPLVTTDGAVVGIVTGIYNPTEQRVFIGIGFAVPIENAASAVGLSPF